MNSTMSMLGLACCLALTTIGCDPEQDESLSLDESEASFRTGDWGCRTCGLSNSPVFGTFPIDRFVGEDGPKNAELRLTEGESPSGARYPMHVDGQTLLGETPSGAVQGAALLGWSMVLSDGVTERLVEITSVQDHPDWVDGGMIPTYGLAYPDPTDPDHPLVNVCPDLDPDETSVVFITDELYDTTAKTVEPNQPSWVTMACRGHALMKMKFFGYDPNDGYGSTWEQRQATLKMITADYCGSGHSFTVVGQPLQWVDERGHFPMWDLPYVGMVEAKWSPDGALCLDQPRHATRAEVEDHCYIPECEGDDDLGGAQWVSLLTKP